MYGYRPAEAGVVLTANERPDPSFRVRRLRKGFFDEVERKAVRVSLGPHVDGVSLPVPDFDHAPSILAGCTKRVAAEMPPQNRQFIRGFRQFVKRFRHKHLQSLKFSPDDKFDFQSWIDQTPYPKYRKEELTKIFHENETVNYQALNSRIHKKRYRPRVKAFVKNENYPAYKHFRGIYSRDDAYKVRVGPYFQKFGDRLFALPWFIKKIPVPDRPHALKQKFEKFKQIFCTDFSQFEATFVATLFNIELDVYRWSLEGHPLQRELMDVFRHMASTNVIYFKTFTCELEAKRMSGEMNTSCGNGLMNLLMTCYVLRLAGNDLDKCDFFFEGDDGIIGCQVVPNPNLYTALGACIKLERPKSLSTASFCGMVFHTDVGHNVSNPSEATVAFGWCKADYRHAKREVLDRLLRAKSYSYLYQYPGCPVLRNLALFGLRVTNHIKDRITFEDLAAVSTNRYRADMLKDSLLLQDTAFTTQIDYRTRLLVEELYGVSISSQLEIEKYLDSLSVNQPLDINHMLNCPQDWFDNDANYCTMVNNLWHQDPAFVRKGFTTVYYTDVNTLFAIRH
jgi:hypothetical protein